MSRYVIGLTGGIACGKSNLSRALRAAGAQVVDADEISHELTQKNGKALPGIRALFGDSVFCGGELNRRALGEIVFSDRDKLDKLNAVIHPMILSEIRTRLDAAEGTVILEAPLLYECGLDTLCDETWCAYIPQREQLKRLCGRDGITRRQALERIRSQMSALKKARLADRVIRTDGEMAHSAEMALRLYRDTVNGRE